MLDYQQRVIDEQAALVEKLSRLDDFFAGSVFSTLPSDDQTLLREQRVFMDGYNKVLQRRIDRFSF